LTSSSPAILLLLDQRVAGHRAPARPSMSPAVALLFNQPPHSCSTSASLAAALLLGRRSQFM
jgi:hypothetical protein